MARNRIKKRLSLPVDLSVNRPCSIKEPYWVNYHDFKPNLVLIENNKSNIKQRILSQKILTCISENNKKPNGSKPILLIKPLIFLLLVEAISSKIVFVAIESIKISLDILNR